MILKKIFGHGMDNGFLDQFMLKDLFWWVGEEDLFGGVGEEDFGKNYIAAFIRVL